MNFTTILAMLLILTVSSCSTTIFKKNDNITLENKNVTKEDIYNELMSLYKRGTKIRQTKKKPCINQMNILQDQAHVLKLECDKRSYVNLSISANHLELCTSCTSPTAKEHCNWALESLRESKISQGW